jgi:steroid delta-isomerase-like uncharacterized protein
MRWQKFAVASAVLAACSMVASGFAPQDQGHRSQVIKFMDEVWGKGNLAYIDQAMDPQIARFGHVAEGNTFGIAAYKSLVTKVRSSFTDYNFTLLDMMGVGNKATFKWQLRGNYVGADKKLSPGRTVDIMGKTVWIFRGDKVVREIVEMDQEEYHRQIAMAVPYSEVGSRALMLSYLYEVLSQGDVSSLDELVAETHVLHAANNKDLVGKDALREHVLDLRAAFPDLALKIHDVIADANIVSARWTLSGTQRGEWNGVPATNRRIDATGLTMMRIKDDKIQETWSVLDLLLVGPKADN